MGYDLFGTNPKSDKGGYFRASIWTWPSIHMLIADTGVLAERELEAILYNDGYQITELKARRIAEGVEALIAAAPDDAEFLNLDSPIAKMGDELIKAFVGQGATIQQGGDRFVDMSYVREFIEFARDSGGFEVL
jgi:hypothetical protein